MSGSKCVRCGRMHTDPKSIERGMGPICWGKSRGDIFEKDLEADEQEWKRRESVLKSGGEIDFGCNWQYIDYNPEMAIQLPVNMRVSLRYKDGAYEVYGVIYDPKGNREVVFHRTSDIKDAYKAAVQAGPYSNANVARIQKIQRQKLSRLQNSKKQMRLVS